MQGIDHVCFSVYGLINSSCAGGSDRVCGITANGDVHILWWCSGSRPDVYLQNYCDYELLP